MQQPGLNIGYLAFNNQKPPFTDKRVRIAINMAIDKQAILQAVYQGAGQPAKNLIPPTMWSYNNQVQDFPHDPEQAKKLLAEAGFPNGFETDIWAMPVQRPYNPDARRIAELMQSDLAKVGIKAKVVSYEWGEYRKRVQARRAPDGASSAGPATTAIPTTSSSRSRAAPRRARAAAVHRSGATRSSTR